MLTIFALTNATQAAKYYEADNYYHKGSVESIAATHWWGKGAELLGLSDYVDPEKFVELLKGNITPDVKLERIRHDGGVGHKPGYDLTFSAPKSVSMLAEIGRDFRIHDAHNKAVNKALEYLQSRATRYRHTVDSDTQIKQSDNLIVAKFRHDTSRSVEDTIDCQLHTHCVVINATQCADGKWRSLSEKPLFDFKMIGGMIYRSTLAKELKELGYEIEKTREDGLFEIIGFNRKQIEEFSKRRVKIVEVMKEQGLFGAEAAQKVMLNLRESKTPIDRQKLEEHWQTRIQELGIDLNIIIQNSKAQEVLIEKHSAAPYLVADQALSYAIAHLGERQSAFKEKDILLTSLQYALGSVLLEDVEAALKWFEASEKIVYLGEHKYEKLYTTPKVLEQEKQLVEIMKNGKNEVDPIASKAAVDLYFQELASRYPDQSPMTNCQKKAIEFLSTTTDRIVGVQGYAGTGKTTMLQAVCDIAKQAGYTLRGAAPPAAASDVLRHDTGIETSTLSKLIIDLLKESNNYKSEIKQNKISPPELLIIDEASMASTQQMHDLLRLAEKLDKRIILVGDRNQLPAVENGAPFALLQDAGLLLTILIEVIRQKAPDLKFAVNETIHNNLDIAFEAIGNSTFASKPGDGKAFYSPSSTITEIENKDQRLETIANAYLALDKQGRTNTIVLLGSNDDRQVVNSYIRQGLQNDHQINTDQTACSILQNKGFTAIEKTHIYNYQVDDIVRFNKAYRSVGIKPFDYCTVKSIDHKTNELILTHRNKEIRWKPENSAKTKGGAVDVFIQEERQLAKGDYLRWTQNRKNHHIFNTDTAHVLSVKGNIAEVQLKDGKTISLDMRESINKHWDYAWSSTIYAAQGRKAQNVIAQLESYNSLITHYRSFYVTLSRAVNSIHLYVDNLEKAIDTVKKHTGEKSNATEFLESYQEKLQFEQFIKESALKLEGRIHEDPNELSRLVKLAKDYAKLSENNQRLKHKKKIYLMAPDFKDRSRLNALIREELKTAGVISTAETTVKALRQFRVHSQDSHLKFSEGMVIGFNRGYKKYGIQKGEYVSIQEMNDLTQTVIVKQTSGRRVEIEKSFLVDQQDKDTGIYKVDNLPLSQGDQIIFDKTFKEASIIEHQSATVMVVTDKEITLALKKNQSITLAKNDPKLWHWHYAYAKGLQDEAPKSYDIALSHLDEKTHSTNRIEAIFGALGKAKEKSSLYTHSQTYIAHKFQELIEPTLSQSLSKNELDNTLDNKKIKSQHHDQKPDQNSLYDKVSAYYNAQRPLSKAWVSYFEAKKAHILPDENLRNAVILDRAQAELANQIITNEQYNPQHIQALGINVEKLQKYADKHKIIHTVQRYQQSAIGSISRGYYSREIATHFNDFAKELQANNIDEKLLRDESFKYNHRLEHLSASTQTRKDLSTIEAYFEKAQIARHQWQRIYRSKDEGIKPDRTKFTFASHVSHVRNQLAHEIISHPERFKDLTKHLKAKTKSSIEKHAKDYTKTLEKEKNHQRALETKNWRQLVEYDQSQLQSTRDIQPSYSNQHKKVYWDKDIVMRAAMSRVEQILSSVIEEDKNYKLSKGNKLVWGKKHGSIQYHVSGSKEGVVNDYERGIHGDLITYYAKRRGLDWYNAVSELAAQTGLDPKRDSIQLKPINANEIQQKNQQKEKIILEEQKRREKMRQLAQKTWNEAKPITGTIVETYLKQHRGMKFDLSKIEVRYHPQAPNIVSYKDDKVRVGDKRPAMIVAFKNHQEELTGIQCTYLDKETANKDKSVQIPKCTLGQIWGSAGIVYRGNNDNVDKIVVAEGFETAASLIPATPDSAIYITGGNMQNVGQFKFLAEKHNKNELYIAADNDLSFDAGSWKATEAGARQLAESGVRPLVSLPDTIKNKKTDYNDVLIRYGEREVKNQFDPQFTIDDKQPITRDTKLNPIKSHIEKLLFDPSKEDQLYRLPDMPIKHHQIIQPNKEIGIYRDK